MICVDASVVAKWILDEEFSDQAQSLYRSAIDANELIVAPVYVMIEVNNVLLKRIRQRELSPEAAADRFRLLQKLQVRLLDPDPLHQEALALAVAHQLPAIYDAYYLALASTMRCPFWTADKKLINALDGRLPFVRWIGHAQV